jgi:hypothetical protein
MWYDEVKLYRYGSDFSSSTGNWNPSLDP